MSELLVYKASAGSGKTFTLAVEYIKLFTESSRKSVFSIRGKIGIWRLNSESNSRRKMTHGKMVYPTFIFQRVSYPC